MTVSINMGTTSQPDVKASHLDHHQMSRYEANCPPSDHVVVQASQIHPATRIHVAILITLPNQEFYPKWFRFSLSTTAASKSMPKISNPWPCPKWPRYVQHPLRIHIWQVRSYQKAWLRANKLYFPGFVAVSLAKIFHSLHCTFCTTEYRTVFHDRHHH